MVNGNNQNEGMALAVSSGGNMSLTDTMTLGKVLSQSGYFSDVKQAGQAVVKILAGAELGIGPISAMTGIYIVKGKVSLSANLIAAAIRRKPQYDYRIVSLTDTGCELEFFYQNKPAGTVSFNKGNAEKAGLLSGDNWRKWPRNMYFARAMSNGAKWHCPDVFGGPIYTPDELGAEVDGETGEVVKVESVTVTTLPDSIPVSNPRLLEHLDNAVQAFSKRSGKGYDETVTELEEALDKPQPEWEDSELVKLRTLYGAESSLANAADVVLTPEHLAGATVQDEANPYENGPSVAANGVSGANSSQSTSDKETQTETATDALDGEKVSGAASLTEDTMNAIDEAHGTLEDIKPGDGKKALSRICKSAKIDPAAMSGASTASLGLVAKEMEKLAAKALKAQEEGE